MVKIRLGQSVPVISSNFDMKRENLAGPIWDLNRVKKIIWSMRRTERSRISISPMPAQSCSNLHNTYCHDTTVSEMSLKEMSFWLKLLWSGAVPEDFGDWLHLLRSLGKEIWSKSAAIWINSEYTSSQLYSLPSLYSRSFLVNFWLLMMRAWPRGMADIL
jgi:hypothetical protein